MFPPKPLHIGILLLVTLTTALATEKEEWRIAAEMFSAKDVSPIYASFPTIIPKLILSNISGIQSRMVMYDELKAREIQSLSESRIALIRARSELVLSRDRIMLLSDPTLVKSRKQKELDRKIKAKEVEITEAGKKITEVLSGTISSKPSVRLLKLWKNSTDLYLRPTTSGLATALEKEGISGLISGTVQDIAGYMYVTAWLETGISGMPKVAVSEAASYDDIENLVDSLTVRLLPEIAKRQPVSISLSVQPAEARVFIDGRLIQDFNETVTVFSGSHIVSATATGYLPAELEKNFKADPGAYAVTIELVRETLLSIGFDTGSVTSSLYFHTRYFGDTPLTAELPVFPTVGQSISGDITTWFIFRPDNLDPSKPHMMTVKPNTVNTEKRIEKQRSILYWSLGALYLSLPVTLLTYGISIDKNQAYLDGKTGYSADIENWSRISNVSRGVSLGLGVNVIIQIVRYLIAAEQTTPREAEQSTAQ